jgi:argininosuccinate synthase
MESITMDREVLRIRDSLIPDYSARIYNGFWFSPEMRTLNAFVDATQENVTGTVRLKLYKGNCTVVGRKSPVSLYDERIATMDADQGAYQQALATGFIELNAIRLIADARVRGRE